MRIPQAILKHLYTYGSLRNVKDGVEFSLTNRLKGTVLSGLSSLVISGVAVAPENVDIFIDNRILKSADITTDTPLDFNVDQTVTLRADIDPLEEDRGHLIELQIKAEPFGDLQISVEDRIGGDRQDPEKIPHSMANDYSTDIIDRRVDYIRDRTGIDIPSITHYSVEPGDVRGNIENFIGVAQVPVGVAGPLRVNGEYADGEFLIPLATTEGTLVASYNRGIKVLNLSGGVKTTIQDDAMQRAPVFIFDSAREAREFSRWIKINEDSIGRTAEGTSKVCTFKGIQIFLVHKFAFLRFNYGTGDAAGQNMVGKATFEACSWIAENYDGIREFYLESNIATDKKSSRINMLNTRGKRVTAEAIIPRNVILEQLRADPDKLIRHNMIGNIGAFMAGAHNNGLHSANAIAALFIACGQDAANVAESSAGFLHAEINEDGDLYASLTLPSLIVATYGGGTGLPTQRECLSLMGCSGPGNVRKFTEIVAGVALAGEISLGAAISSLEWVKSHEELGRNR